MRVSSVKHRRREFIAKARPGRNIQALAYLGLIGLLGAAFLRPLCALAGHAATSGLHSYILLVPFITGYLVFLNWDRLPRGCHASPEWASFPAALGLVALGSAWALSAERFPVSQNDLLSLYALAFVSWVIAGGFALMGFEWMRAIAFPAAFLVFMVPIPDGAVEWMESGLKLASAEAASVLFGLSGLAVFRDGLVFHLPGVTMEVAQECSGIRSSVVLFITSLLASYLLLQSPWRRFALVALVIPLGIIRNGLRILVLGILAVRVGPDILQGAVHNRGGPVFFALSLVPLLILLWWLRRGEQGSGSLGGGTVKMSREGY